MKIAVSACLLGHNCKYNGKNNFNKKLAALLEGHEVIPVCPEMMGGLDCPRIPCEINQEGRVIGRDGKDYTENYEAGAQKALETAIRDGAELVILQPRSPSCSCHKIYDGTFTGTLKDGVGIFAGKCIDAKLPIMEAPSENPD